MCTSMLVCIPHMCPWKPEIEPDSLDLQYVGFYELLDVSVVTQTRVFCKRSKNSEQMDISPGSGEEISSIKFLLLLLPLFF